MVSSCFLMACNFPSGRVKPHFPVRFLICRLPPSRLLQVLPTLFYASLNPSPTVSHMLSSRSCFSLAVSFRCGIWISYLSDEPEKHFLLTRYMELINEHCLYCQTEQQLHKWFFSKN